MARTFDVNSASSNERLGGARLQGLCGAWEGYAKITRAKLLDAAPAGVAAEPRRTFSELLLSRIPMLTYRKYTEDSVDQIAAAGRRAMSGKAEGRAHSQTKTQNNTSGASLFHRGDKSWTEGNLRSFTSVTGGDLQSPIPSRAADALEKWTGRAKVLVHWLRESEIRTLWVQLGPQASQCASSNGRKPSTIMDKELIAQWSRTTRSRTVSVAILS